MGVIDELDDREAERFYQAVLQKLAELAEEFPELEEAGRKIDPDELFAPIRYRTDEEKAEHDALMERAERVIERAERTLRESQNDATSAE